MNKLFYIRNCLAVFGMVFSAASIAEGTIHSRNQTSFDYNEIDGIERHYGVFLVDPENDQSVTISPGVWTVSGDIGLSLEYIDLKGDETRSPLRFDGDHQFVDFNFRATKETISGGHFRAEIAGVVNNSDYRTRDQGLEIEKGFVEWEQAGERVSSWIRSGDIYGNLSPRTLQRPLKGVVAELQFTGSRLPGEHSLQLLSGVQSPDFSDLSTDDGWFNSISSLWTHNTGAVIVNYLRYRDDFLQRQTSQELYSLGFEQQFSLTNEARFSIEGEYGHLKDKTGVDEQFFSTSADGKFLSARAELFKGLSITANYEDYDSDYLPRGRSIIADRKTREARLLWSLSPNLRLTGRTQEFIDRRSSGNPLTTQVVGARLNGRFSLGNYPINFSLDAFSRERFDLLATIDAVSDNLDLEATINGANNTSHQFNAIYLSNQDDDQQTHSRGTEFGYRFGKSFMWNAWKGFAQLGMLYRDVSTDSAFLQTDSEELGFTVNARLSRGKFTHELLLSSLDQDRLQNQLEDFRRNNYGYRLRYQNDQHELEINIRQFLNKPDPGLDSQTRQFNVNYRYFFNRRLGVPAIGGYSSLTSNTLMTSLQPGLNQADVEAALTDFSVGSPSMIDEYQVFNHTVWPMIDGNQRLFVKRNELGDLVESGVIIDFTRVNDLNEIEQEYNRMRAQLLRTLGQPTFSDGRFDVFSGSDEANLTQTFLRHEEWRFKDSRIALVIPNSLDGKLRMRVLHIGASQSLESANLGLDTIQ